MLVRFGVPHLARGPAWGEGWGGGVGGGQAARLEFSWPFLIYFTREMDRFICSPQAVCSLCMPCRHLSMSHIFPIKILIPKNPAPPQYSNGAPLMFVENAYVLYLAGWRWNMALWYIPGRLVR